MRRSILRCACSIVFMLSVPTAVFAQVYAAWVQRYNGTGNGADAAEAVRVDAAGNVYVTGYSAGVGTGNDIATLKYSPDGQLLWTQRYDGAAHLDDRGAALDVDADGNVYVTGECDASETAGDWITIKYDEDGNLLWFQQYGTSELIDRGHVIRVDVEGNVHVAGASGEEYATVKYDPDGALLWEQREAGYDTDADAALCLDEAGNVFVTVRRYTLKYDAGGIEIWSRALPGIVYDVVLDPDGYVCVVGSYRGNYSTGRIRPHGVTDWQREYNGASGLTDDALAVRADAAGNVYVTGTADQGQTRADYTTVKYDADGNQIWVRSYDYYGSEADRAVGLELDAHGNVYVTGSSASSHLTDYATLGYSPDGELLWERRYDGTGGSGDVPTDLEVDPAGNVYVTGYSAGEGSSYDYVTIKYAPDTVAPRLTIGVLQNPILPSHIEIQAVADEPLYESVVIEVNGVRLTAVDAPGDLDNTFTARYELSGAGTITLRAVCLDRAMNRTEVTDSFESFPVDGGGGLLAASDGTVRLDIPANAVAGNQYILLFRESGSAGTQYDLRPHSLRFDRAAELRIEVGGRAVDATRHAIFRRNDAADWEQLPTYVDPASGALVAFVDCLGVFEVRATHDVASPLLPRAPVLAQNYPNPFNAGTVIAFTLDRPCRATLEVFNVLGQHVATLTDREWPAGTHQIAWDGEAANGRSVASGVYYYRLRTPSATQTRRMVLIK